ncbi:Spc7 kinetochore protein-domain-containing protein [Salix suchowensis]|nr:Spc7 kinetochore protein-domain-containing protein [Salix suchowensis]
MDLTREFTTNIHDNTSRKSLGRRVSFARTAKVRLFEIQGDHTSSTNASGSPQSSPQSSPQQQPNKGQYANQPPTLSNENAYPGADARNRRRSSGRYSTAGSEDMDLTQIGPHMVSDEFNFEEDNFDFNTDDDSHMMDEDGDTMDVTRRWMLTSFGDGHFLWEAVAASNNNELSVGSVDMSQDMSQDMSRDDSNVSGGDDTQSVPMEFTVPITQGLRQPAHQDPAWLALRAVTHSGDVPYEPPPMSEDEDAAPLAAHAPGDDMNLDDAMQRLMRARDSLPMAQSILPGSLAGLSARPSLAYDSTMEVTSAYGHIQAINGLPVESTPTHGRIAPQPAPTQEMARSPVFQPPSVPVTFPVDPPSGQPKSIHAAPAPVFAPPPKAPTSASKFKPTPKPTSPVKSKPTFTAAFAPPAGRPSPKKPQPPATNANAGSSTNARGPAKRPLDETLEEDHEEGHLRVVLPWTPTTNLSQRPFQHLVPLLNPILDQQYGVHQVTLLGGKVWVQPCREEPTKRLAGQTRPHKVPVRLHRKPPERVKPERAWARQRRQTRGSGSTEMRPPISALPPASPARDPPSATPGAPNHLEGLSTADGFGEDDNEASMELDEEIPVRQPDDQARLRASTAATELWAEGVQGDGHPDDNLVKFFQLTGIKFMEELTAPRRSMSQPGRPERQTADIPLAEYAIATTVDLPQLSLYTRVASDLDAWMKKSKVVMQETEEEAAKVVPELFAEYLSADEEGKDQLRHQLNLIRTNVREMAKGEWYNWKLQWIEGLKEIASSGLKDLQADAKVLGQITSRAEEMLPFLEQEYEKVTAELEQEQAEVDEILASDQGYLNELKASIAEQEVEVDALHAELSENKQQLARLQERYAETQKEQRESESAISTAKRLLHVQESSTLSEIMRLKDELEAMEDLHMFHATKVSHNLFEYVYASRYQISIPCNSHLPIISQIELKKLNTAKLKFKDKYPHLSDFFLRIAKDTLLQTQKDWTVRKIRSQLDLLSIKYPVTVEIPTSTDSAGFTAKAQLLYPSLKAKVFVSFTFIPEIFASWPKAIKQLPCNVEVAYGAVQYAHFVLHH